MFIRKTMSAALLASVLAAGAAVAADTAPARTTEQTADDTSIGSKVKAALIDNETTKARQINVEVYKGTVQLNGFVDTAEEKSVAGKLAGDVAGVMNVKNNLEVKSGERTAGQTVDDGMITAKVKSALIGDSRTKAHQINVTTREGVVELGGFVDSPTAKAAATEVAKSIDGVKSVQNGLSVKK